MVQKKTSSRRGRRTVAEIAEDMLSAKTEAKSPRKKRVAKKKAVASKPRTATTPKVAKPSFKELAAIESNLDKAVSSFSAGRLKQAKQKLTEVLASIEQLT